MAEPLRCYRCGASLAGLSLPLARLDECPSCRASVHACNMCVHYAPRLANGCDEDDAPEVRDKAAANFCDWFRPDHAAYVAPDASAEAAARAELEALFDSPSGERSTEGSEAGTTDTARQAAEALFKK